ncbi:MAG TPA: sigma-54-dependent Fis family transcriptional regulator [Noviherbaspirillum sp.]|nr:sigma-54-dependent Fis family transcriptional regulator [Noviherbaspirillum sp.]
MLHSYAIPVMETLFEQIANTGSMVVLTGPAGVVLHAIGDRDFMEKTSGIGLQPGVRWSECSKGTNAIGTAIVEQAPTVVHADEHYLAANRFLTCSAVPVFDHQRRIAGILGVAGDHVSFHHHTMALVRLSAQMIENQLFSTTFRNAITVHFHSRPEFIGTLMENTAAFTAGGRFLSANHSAMRQFGLPRSALETHTFSSLFGLPLSELFDHYCKLSPGLLTLCLYNGLRVHAHAELRIPAGAIQETAASTALETRRPSNASLRFSSLHYLNTGDPQIAGVIDKVGKVIGRDIPILILGETGTGKELLAQAIHNDSPHAGGPFVAVNCASIPETLIESELFGYEDGAFTGARRKGSAGKILQANGGTLFLDEIGDMPLNLQARLLRVLQERTVTPLGCTKSYLLNIALVCATNRNLREQIARNAFREDLYYRLNGLVIKLPPLRERTDLETVVDKLLAAHPGTVRRTISPELMQVFKRHRWPGNVRQLASLVRTAIIMAGDQQEIGMEHMPEDFLEDIGAMALASGGGPQAASGSTLEDVELSMMRKTLEELGGNVSAAARALGVSRNTIYRKMNL